MSDGGVSPPTTVRDYEQRSISASADVEGYVITKCGERRQSVDEISVEFDIDSSYVEFRTGVFTQVKFGLPAPKVTDGLYVYEVPTQPFPRDPTLLNQIAQQVDAHLRQICGVVTANSPSPLGQINELRRYLTELTLHPIRG